jgi:hypothetical protein
MKGIILIIIANCIMQSGFAQVADSVTASAKQAPVAIADSGILVKAAVKLYPNPVKNKVTLELTGFAPGLVQVQLFNSGGKIERNDNRLLTSGNEQLVMMFALPAGVYLITVKQKEKIVKKKMVVQ